MRVLLSCYGFSPYRGSEAAVGWNIAKELATHCDVTVVCGDLADKQEVKQDLEKWKQCGEMIPNLHFSYVGPTRLIKFIEKIHNLPGCWALYYLAYRLWQKQAYKRAQKLYREQAFDLVHHLTMIGYREPGYMWNLPIPFVWGPVGGAPNEPIAYLKLFSVSGCVKVFLRTVCNEIQKRIYFRAKKAAKCAKKVWAVTDADCHMIRDLWGVKCEKMVETGTVLRSEGYVREWSSEQSLRIVWSGIHTSRKALPILIYALAQVRKERPNADIVVDILGEGPETEGWKRLAGRLGVAQLLNWHGRLPHDQALKVMNGGHVFAFPSLKEGTPHVVLEALSLGLPVICHDACGMGIVVNEACGIKVPMVSPDESILGFSTAISGIISGEVSVESLSRGALARSRELNWKEKAKLISRAYEEIIHE